MAAGLALETLQSFPQLSSAVAYRVSANFNRENPDSVGAHCDFLLAGYRSTSLLHTVFLYFLGSVLSRFFCFLECADPHSISAVSVNVWITVQNKLFRLRPNVRQYPPFISKITKLSSSIAIGYENVPIFEPT
jgi:hypothetical protein